MSINIDSLFYYRKLSFGEFKNVFLSLAIIENTLQGGSIYEIMNNSFVDETIKNLYELYEINWSQIND